MTTSLLTLPLISGYTAAFLGLLQMILMVRVGLARGDTKISLGDGGDETLLRKIRRHGNLTENAALFLVLLVLFEISGGPEMIVLGLALVFVLARLSHAYALSRPDGPLVPRAIGAMGTLLAITGASISIIILPSFSGKF